MTTITDITALEILDSRGKPTVMATTRLADNVSGSACVPSGASTGEREAVELRDNDTQRYLGQGVRQAVEAINGTIRDQLVGRDASDQRSIDHLLCEIDGSTDKSRLGANAILAASLSVLHAAAAAQSEPVYRTIATLSGTTPPFDLPLPMMNILNGGAHANNNIDIQEFMVLPLTAPNFAEAVRHGAEVFHALKSLLQQKGLATTVGDEGGVAPDLPSNQAALDILIHAIEYAGFQTGKEIGLALDCAASEMYHEGAYIINAEKQRFDSLQFVEYLQKLCADYPILSIEDGMDENDREGWALMSERLNDKIQIVGDDLFVTNATELQQGIDEHIANSILIKLNQIGTVSETLDTIRLARTARYNTIISHRSGETEDVTIADLAVGLCAGQIKTGAPCRSERVAKYNRLLVIENELGDQSRYIGQSALKR